MLFLWLSMVALAWGQRLPSPRLRPLLSGGGEFSIQDVPGIASVQFVYRSESENIFKGQAFKGFDGYWRHISPSVDLSKEKTFIVTVLFEDGTEEKVKETFFPETQALMPPGGKRQANCFFHDDFNTLDKGKWKHEVSMFGGGNWEFQVYTPEPRNSFVREGHLFLKPTFTIDDPKFNENFLTHGTMDMQKLYGVCTNSGNFGCHREGQNGMLPPIMSAKLMSIPTLKFGTVEVRAKIPSGCWIWPAIWMMPVASKYGGWPRSGEIDIMESRGNPGPSGVHSVSSTLHWGAAPDQNHFSQTHKEKTGPDYSVEFHNYKLNWNGEHLTTHVDADPMLNVQPPPGGFYAFGHLSGANPWAGGSKMAPFDQEFYLILNVAVGGTNGFFPEGQACGGGPKPWSNTSPHASQEFWSHHNVWGSSWKGEQVAMKIDHVTFCHP